MVGRAAEKAGVQLGPAFQRGAALDQLLMTARQLPDAIGAASLVAGYLKRHQLAIFRSRLEVIERCDRPNRSSKRGMLRHVACKTAVDVDLPAILQQLDMPYTRLEHDALLRISS